MFMPEQYASVLNNVFAEITGQYKDEDGNPTATFNEDLSNFIDVGKKITSSTEWGDNFDRYVGKLIDQIGKIVIEDKSYTSNLPKLEVDAFEYGAILEKIRVGEIDFEENPAWNLQKGQSYDYTTFNPVDAEATFFSNKTSFMMEWSWVTKQLKSAFDSKSNMMRLFSAIENKIRIKKQITTDNIKLRLINAINAENIAKGRCVNLLEVFRTETNNSSLTAQYALVNPDFLRHAGMTLKKYIQFIGMPSKIFNQENVLQWANKADLKMVCITDFDSAMSTYLYADTWHNEFVKFDGYSAISNWQGINEELDFENRSSINVSLASDDETVVRQSGIVFTMFDKNMAVVYNENDETDVAPHNPVGKFQNYYYSYDCSYMLDLGENSVTFIISDYSPVHEEPADWGTGSYFYVTENGAYAAVSSSSEFTDYDVVYKKIV